METTFEQAKKAAITEFSAPADVKIVLFWPEEAQGETPEGEGIEEDHVLLSRLKEAPSWLAGYSEKMNTLVIIHENNLLPTFGASVVNTCSSISYNCAINGE